jgi:predicted RNA-binding protein (virulence factor B family)
MDLVPGNSITVFLYKDSEDMLIATTQTPKVMLNAYAALRAKAVGTFGAFFDWGLEKDLLVPYREQAARIIEGQLYVVHLYLDEASQRLAGSTRINKTFKKAPHDLRAGDQVSLLTYAETQLGISCIVNNAYQGMLFRNEIFEPLSLGTSLTGYVKHIRPDHKIDVRLNRDGYQAVDDNVKKLLDVLQANGGQLNVNDKSSPGQIAALLGMSKKIFKKAVGSLYKQKRLQITETSIRLVDGNFDKKGA